MDFKDYFKGKKVTVMGLGLLGRGVGDAAYLAEAGAAEVLVTDLKTEEQLKASVEKLRQYDNVKFVLGEHRLEDFENRDFILVAAGVPLNSPYLTHAREQHIPFHQSAALFAELSGIPIIGVTGTRGKSTVTQMIHHVLSVVTGEKILLGGNVRGLSNLQLLNEVKEESLCVMELDSWQLQGFGWSGISPQIAVFTNFMEDHLNYYLMGNDPDALVNPDRPELGDWRHHAMISYFADKAQIFLHQHEGDTFITTPEVYNDWASDAANEEFEQEVVLVTPDLIPEGTLLAMPGAHNRLNAALAVAALRSVSLTDEQIFEALASFSGVEGRLQFVKTVDNVRIYNDNNATTPQATVAALKALDLGNKNIILICGGSDKNIPLDELRHAIDTHCKQVITIPGKGTNRLLEETKSVHCNSLKEALEEAFRLAENADIILFSPGFASFGQYNNEYERNDEFMKLISNL